MSFKKPVIFLLKIFFDMMESGELLSTIFLYSKHYFKITFFIDPL